MKNKKSNLKKASQNGRPSKGKSTGAAMKSSQLMKLFEDELKDIYWAEKALTKSIPELIKNSTSPNLTNALKSHLKQTEKQVTRLENVFESIGKKAVAKKCDAMEGLIQEAKDIMKSSEAGPMRDAGIISAAQKVEHYEIASYGTLSQFAETLGLKKAVTLLNATLKEEKAADEKLSKVATASINVEAAKVEA